MHSYGASTSREGRPYQGYPYVNPMVNDVATVDPETAAKWSALPRKPGTLYEEPGTSRQDLPSSSTRKPDTGSPAPREQNSETLSDKVDYDANPVVYIELPESSGSEVAEQRRPPVEESFVQQTIFYDQFKDRTVVTVSDDARSNRSSSSGSSNSYVHPSTIPRPTRPAPPVTLPLRSPDSGYPSPSRGTPGASAMMSKESAIYGAYSNDDCSQNLEMREFPNPPPAYSKYDTLSPSPGTPPIIRQPRPVQVPNSPLTPVPGSPIVLNPANLPPRTQVIVPAIDTENTKIVFCKFCGMNSPSFVIKQVGLATHVVAFILFMFGLIPCAILLYYSNSCRYKNHYCKQCNNLMAYEIPFLGKKLTYAT